MSKEAPVILTLAEKILGIVLIILGAIIAYYSIGATGGDFSHLSGLFTVAGLVIAAIGIFMFITKHE